MSDHSNRAPILATALSKLVALDRDGEGVQEVLAVGEGAIPGLRDILFRRERSGLYQVRCRAVEALGQLGAFEVLKEFLREREAAADPVERLGDDVVISAAARWLAWSKDRGTFSFLFQLARRRPLSGTISALASFRRPEAIPILVGALGEDELRLTAERAILSYGSAARSVLLDAADHFRSSSDPSETDLRHLRSVLSLLGEIRLKPADVDRIGPFMASTDSQVCLFACRAVFRSGKDRVRSEARARLLELRSQGSWLERLQVDHILGQAAE